MTSFPGYDRQRARLDIAPDVAPESPDLKLSARIEGLCGEEEALLKIPAARRNGQQTARLRAISAELDRLWESLRRRAERLTASASAS
jgi:hypothetical protein